MIRCDWWLPKPNRDLGKLTNIGFQVSDELIGTLLLVGLLDFYKIYDYGVRKFECTNGDTIKTKLLQDLKTSDYKRSNNNESA